MRLYVLIILFLLIIALSVKTNDIQFLKEISNPIKFQGFIKSQLADKSTIISNKCSLHMTRFYIALILLRPWAIKMFDSNAKLPSGLLRGHGAALGTFDECLSVKSSTPYLSEITGKYCLGSLLIANLTTFDLGDIPLNLLETRLMNFKESTITLPWGVCFPDSCSATDIQVFHPSILRFNDTMCQTKSDQNKNLDDGDKIAIAVLSIILALVVFSTSYDCLYFWHYNEYGSVLFRSFSLITNGSNIVTIRNETSDIRALHGLRAITLLSIMGGIRYFLFVFAPLHNWLDFLRWFRDPDNSAVLEIFICMDTFLVVSGFLICYRYLEATKNGMRFNIITYYINRIIRLVPSLAILVLLHATLLRHVGSGPVWPKLRDEWLVNNCRQFWWSSLLFVQNYVNPGITGICVLPTWQLSVDMQLFILSPLILFPLRRWTKITLAVLGFLYVCCIMGQFLTAWFYDIKAILVMQTKLEDINNYFDHYFFTTHTRASPWLIGFILGYIVFRTNASKKKIFSTGVASRVLVIVLWIASIILLLLVILMARIYVEYDYDRLSHSAMLGFIRPLWAFAVSWVIFACATGFGGPINALLSSTPFIVLSRISYSMHLVFFSIMFLFTYQTRLGLEFNHTDAIYRICSDLTICIVVGFAWTLLFESPLITIWKHFTGLTKEQKSD